MDKVDSASEFVVYITLGWGERGPVLSAIRNTAARMGVELTPFPWAKMHETVKTYEAKVTGEADAVENFKHWFIARFNPV